jgi:hypothetical protein
LQLARLVSTLTVPSVSVISAKAIKNICRSTKSFQTIPFTDILNVLDQSRRNHILTIDEESYLIEGLCCVLSRAPTDTEEATHFAMLLQPLIGCLQMNLSKNTDMKYIIGDLQALISLFSRIKMRQLQRFPNEKMSEKVCSCYKHIMKSAGVEFKPFVPAMAKHVVECYHVLPYSAFIYVAGVCLNCFSDGEQGTLSPVIFEMFCSLSQIFFATMSSFEHFVDKPDLVEEYFFFATKAIEKLPRPIIHSSFILSLVDAAIIGLKLEHRQAQKGILCFFEKLISYCVSDKSDLSKSLIDKCMGPLISVLILAMSGDIVCCVDVVENDGCAGDVLWNLRLSPNFQVHYLLQSDFLHFPFSN